MEYCGVLWEYCGVRISKADNFTFYYFRNDICDVMLYNLIEREEEGNL